jgi:hemerythrin superfamily protein
MATAKTRSQKKSTPKRSAKGPTKAQDAIALLKADHEKVEGLFDQFEKTRSDDKKVSLAQEICMELKIHTTIEEELFYPAAREAIDDNDLLNEAEIEHESAKELISQIEQGSPDDEKWSARVTVLGEYIKHHVKEEQNEMFREVRKADLDLKALGQQMLTRKEELMQQLSSEEANAPTRANPPKMREQSHRIQ